MQTFEGRIKANGGIDLADLSAYQAYLRRHAGRRVELIVRPILGADSAPDPELPNDEPRRALFPQVDAEQ